MTFGSREDRARQLAARHRKARIASNSSQISQNDQNGQCQPSYSYAPQQHRDISPYEQMAERLADCFIWPQTPSYGHPTSVPQPTALPSHHATQPGLPLVPRPRSPYSRGSVELDALPGTDILLPDLRDLSPTTLRRMMEATGRHKKLGRFFPDLSTLTDLDRPMVENYHNVVEALDGHQRSTAGFLDPNSLLRQHISIIRQAGDSSLSAHRASSTAPSRSRLGLASSASAPALHMPPRRQSSDTDLNPEEASHVPPYRHISGDTPGPGWSPRHRSTQSTVTRFSYPGARSVRGDAYFPGQVSYTTAQSSYADTRSPPCSTRVAASVAQTVELANRKSAQPPHPEINVTAGPAFSRTESFGRATIEPPFVIRAKVSASNAAFLNGGGGAATPSGSPALLHNLFDMYREDAMNAPDTIGAEGSMKYLTDLGADLDGLDSLAALEIVQAPSMGEIGREGFVKGWSNLNCDTLDKQKAHLEDLKKTLPSSKDDFTKVYQYTFQCAKQPELKSFTLDEALVYWELLFTSPLAAVKWSTRSSPWITWWLKFIKNEWKKAVNKDMWKETLKFAQMTLADESMSFWNEGGSWPSVIDDFVEWVKKEKPGSAAADAVEK